MSNRNILEYSPIVIAALNLIRLFLDIEDRFSLMEFAFPLAFLWLIMILVLLDPLSKTIESVKDNNDIYNTSKFLILCIIITFTNYSFIIMGFSISYIWAILFSIISVISFLIVYVIKKEDIKQIWRGNLGKGTLVLSILFCFIFPSALTLIDPIVNEPKLVISPTDSEIYIVDVGGFQHSNIVIRNIRGYAWNVIIKAAPIDDIFIYLDDIRYGIVNYDYFPLGHREEIQFNIDTSYSILPGIYLAELTCEYTNLKNIKLIEEITITIFVATLPPAPALFPAYWYIVLVLFAVLLYLLKRRWNLFLIN